MSTHPELLEELLQVGFRRQNTTFAAGKQANNKLELDYETVAGSKLFNKVVEGLCQLAKPYDPEFIAAVPDGATNFIGPVANRLGTYAVYLKKRPAIDYAVDLDSHSAACLERGVLLEDVLNSRLTTSRTLQVANLGPKISAVIGIFDRGLPEERVPIDQPVHSLAALPIPAMLPTDSELWQYAR